MAYPAEHSSPCRHHNHKNKTYLQPHAYNIPNMYLIKREEPNHCCARCADEPLTIKQIVLHCPLYIYIHHYKKYPEPSLNHDVLGEPDQPFFQNHPYV